MTSQLKICWQKTHLLTARLAELAKSIIYVRMICELIDSNNEYVMSANISDQVGEGCTYNFLECAQCKTDCKEKRHSKSTK